MEDVSSGEETEKRSKETVILNGLKSVLFRSTYKLYMKHLIPMEARQSLQTERPVCEG